MISRPNGKLFKRSTKKGEKSENGEREDKRPKERTIKL